MSEAGPASFAEKIPQAEPIRMRTLALLRWFAIAGQLAAVITALAMGMVFPVLPALLLIAAAGGMNLWLFLQAPARTSPDSVVFQLLFDVAQISALLGLTGGMANPFALLVLAPVTIAATALNARHTLALGVATVALITLSALLAIPVHYPDGTAMRLDPLLDIGHWLALVIGVFFFSGYAHRVTAELSATSNALFATQMALAREQRLQHLGGVVAAAAHEMGTPLATIKLITSELIDEWQDRPELADDLASLRDSADRCAHILRSMGRAGKDDLLLRSAPLSTIIEDAIGPHADRGPSLEIHATDISVRRDPAIIHALRNLIQNAVDFADKHVVIEATHDNHELSVSIRDDGPGYPPSLLARIGDPYLTSRRTGAHREGYEGMGLGLFIAKTLLERSGARLRFSNGGPGAAVDVIWPLDRLRIDDRAALGENPHQES
ncbi:ActS/PrrB/RegB family redox-sensitive histidine kinase [Paracoccus alkanivorans]|uniref:histidine kinase n=1 Tax=Paracoccus alkanivorans TaxID=2116655 RepID=A0A3M0MAR7_9RHOB|nr:ActS/PrrB/RegB family redox-sensitive histidine kinase [Paracoccus alkanivorans]RMC34699.1 sensor histidine kinase [Paracoccus alkanivorans]